MNQQADDYITCIIAIGAAIRDIGTRGDGDQYGISTALYRALGLRELVQCYEAGELTAERMIANREAIHDALGAPGDWGYDTELGVALARLYQLRLPRPLKDETPGQEAAADAEASC